MTGPDELRSGGNSESDRDEWAGIRRCRVLLCCGCCRSQQLWGKTKSLGPWEEQPISGVPCGLHSGPHTPVLKGGPLSRRPSMGGELVCSPPAPQSDPKNQPPRFPSWCKPRFRDDGHLSSILFTVPFLHHTGELFFLPTPEHLSFPSPIGFLLQLRRASIFV